MAANATLPASQDKSLAELAKKTLDGQAAINKRLDDLDARLKTMPAPGTPSPGQVFGLPHARHGEDPLTSRGYSFAKMLGVLAGVVEPQDAKVECLDVHEKLHKGLVTGKSGDMGYTYSGKGLAGTQKILAPLCTNFLPDHWFEKGVKQEIKSMVGANQADYDEMRWLRQRQLKGLGYDAKALSWLNEVTGGALVAPPEQGEIIELLRNKEALVNAGARTVPLPPQGRLKYPRQTSASNTYWVGENAPITDSNIGTGEVTLQGKKLAVMVKSPNELIRFASPAAEALVRDDMTKSLALGLDLAGLEAIGTDNRPRGVINLPGITQLTSSAPGVNGDALTAVDIWRFIAAVEEANAEFEGFIMRPKTLYRYYQLRWDAVAQGDRQGGFLLNLIREAGDGAKPVLGGYPVTTSTQVSQSRSKGSATDLTYIVAGMWSDLLIGMFGAIEFAAMTQGDTAFTNDQTWIRGILTADIQARHDAAFVWMDNLLVTG